MFDYFLLGCFSPALASDILGRKTIQREDDWLHTCQDSRNQIWRKFQRQWERSTLAERWKFRQVKKRTISSEYWHNTEKVLLLQMQLLWGKIWGSNVNAGSSPQDAETDSCLPHTTTFVSLVKRELPMICSNHTPRLSLPLHSTCSAVSAFRRIDYHEGTQGLSVPTGLNTWIVADTSVDTGMTHSMQVQWLCDSNEHNFAGKRTHQYMSVFNAALAVVNTIFTIYMYFVTTRGLLIASAITSGLEAVLTFAILCLKTKRYRGLGWLGENSPLLITCLKQGDIYDENR